MLNADLHAARHKAAEQQSQNKRLFGGAFRCARRNTPCDSSVWAHANDTLKSTLGEGPSDPPRILPASSLIFPAFWPILSTSSGQVG